MNTIITFRRLTELIAKATNGDLQAAEVFVRSFTAVIRDGLTQDKSVKIKGLGEFSVNDSQKIVFTPASEISETVNAPFAIFCAEEIDPSLTAEDLEAAPDNIILDIPKQSELKPEETEDTPEAANFDTDAAESETEPAESETEPAESETEPAEYETEDDEQEEEESYSPQQPLISENNAIMTESQAPIANATASVPKRKEWEEEEDDFTEEDIPTENEEQSFPIFWSAISLVAGLIIGIAIGFFVHDPIEEFMEPSLAEQEEIMDLVDETDGEIAADPQLIEEDQMSTPTDKKDNATTASEETIAPAAPSTPLLKAEPAKTLPAAQTSAEVTEQILEGVTLAKLAKKHYGNSVYWPYIYLENQNVIPNPNVVKLGIIVKIPPLSKYATQPTQEEREAAARKKVQEILSKK